MAFSLIAFYVSHYNLKGSQTNDLSTWCNLDNHERVRLISEIQQHYVTNNNFKDLQYMLRDADIYKQVRDAALLFTRRYGDKQQTTLHCAMERKDSGAVNALLDKATTELFGIRDANGNTPLNTAILAKVDDETQLTIARKMTGEQILLPNNDGWNSLFNAIAGKKSALALVLITTLDKDMLVNDSKASYISWAVHFNQIDVALSLVNKTPLQELVRQLNTPEYELAAQLRKANNLDLIEAIEKKVGQPLDAFMNPKKHQVPAIVQETQAALTAPEIPSIENARLDITAALESGKVEDAQQAGEDLLKAVSQVADYGARVSLEHYEKTAMVKQVLDELRRIAKTSQTMIMDARDNPQSLLPDHSFQGKLRQMLYSLFPSMDRIKSLNDTMEQMRGTPDSVIEEAFQIIRMHREIDERYLPMDKQLADIEELFLNAAREIDERLAQAQRDNDKQLEGRYPDLKRYFVDCATNVRANRAIVHQMGQASGIIISTEVALVGSMRQTRTAMAAIATSTMAVVARAQQALAADTQESSMHVLRDQFTTTSSALEDIVRRLGTDSANLESSQRRLLSAAHVSAAEDSGIPLCIDQPLEVLVPVEANETDAAQPQTAAAPAANM